MATALRDIPRNKGRAPHSQPRAILVRGMSPEQEYIDWTGDLANPADTLFGWSPTAWIAGKASAAADLVKDTGAAIYNTTLDWTKDLLGTLNAAITGQAPATPGPLFELTTGAASSFNRILPQVVQDRLGTSSASNVAGYITLPDGTNIPVPKGQDNTAVGEKTLTDTLKAALNKANLEAATARQANQIRAMAEAAREDEWNKAFALKEREEGQKAEMRDLSIRAAELALEEQLYSAPQRALWGRPSTIAPATLAKPKAQYGAGGNLGGGYASSIPGWASNW